MLYFNQKEVRYIKQLEKKLKTASSERVAIKISHKRREKNMSLTLKDILTFENINGEKLTDKEYKFIARLRDSSIKEGDTEFANLLDDFLRIQAKNKSGGYAIAQKILRSIDEEPQPLLTLV